MEHPITPPQGLVNQWRIQAPVARDGGAIREQYIATQAARWGDDQRLQACCDAIYRHENEPLCGGTAEWLRNAMRPTPPSLKEQAIADLRTLAADLKAHGLGCNTDTIRRALEALSDD